MSFLDVHNPPGIQFVFDHSGIVHNTRMSLFTRIIVVVVVSGSIIEVYIGVPFRGRLFAFFTVCFTLCIESDKHHIYQFSTESFFECLFYYSIIVFRMSSRTILYVGR